MQDKNICQCASFTPKHDFTVSTWGVFECFKPTSTSHCVMSVLFFKMNHSRKDSIYLRFEVLLFLDILSDRHMEWALSPFLSPLFWLHPTNP